MRGGERWRDQEGQWKGVMCEETGETRGRGEQTQLQQNLADLFVMLDKGRWLLAE